MPRIHPTALIDPAVQLSDDVEIGAYAILKGSVQIGPGTVIHEHTHIHGHTVIGRGGRIGPAAYIGLDPQHIKYQGEPTSLIIGDDAIIREMASVHRAFHGGIEHATRVGDRCFIMGGAHIGHDCRVGNDVVLANTALLGGHCVVGDRVFLGGGAAFHQFVRIGRLAVVAGGEALSQDVPPFGAARYGTLKGYNAVGCKRSGMSREAVAAIRAAYLCLQNHRTTPGILSALRQLESDQPQVREITEFIQSSKRGLVPSARPRRGHAADLSDDTE
jgi:UDP-N-acetylglucosamine acyltransferase